MVVDESEETSVFSSVAGVSLSGVPFAGVCASFVGEAFSPFSAEDVCGASVESAFAGALDAGADEACVRLCVAGVDTLSAAGSSTDGSSEGGASFGFGAEAVGAEVVFAVASGVFSA